MTFGRPRSARRAAIVGAGIVALVAIWVVSGQREGSPSPADATSGPVAEHPPAASAAAPDAAALSSPVDAAGPRSLTVRVSSRRVPVVASPWRAVLDGRSQPIHATPAVDASPTDDPRWSAAIHAIRTGGTSAERSAVLDEIRPEAERFGCDTPVTCVLGLEVAYQDKAPPSQFDDVLATASPDLAPFITPYWIARHAKAEEGVPGAGRAAFGAALDWARSHPDPAARRFAVHALRDLARRTVLSREDVDALEVVVEQEGFDATEDLAEVIGNARLDWGDYEGAEPWVLLSADRARELCLGMSPAPPSCARHIAGATSAVGLVISASVSPGLEPRTLEEALYAAAWRCHARAEAAEVPHVVSDWAWGGGMWALRSGPDPCLGDELRAIRPLDAVVVRFELGDPD